MSNLGELLDSAGIRNDEFAIIMDVSIAALCRWKSGSKVHRLRQKQYDAVCSAIASAVAAGDLPIMSVRGYGKHKVRPRAEEIGGVIQRHITSSVANPDNAVEDLA
jgi:hypothetical protein